MLTDSQKANILYHWAFRPSHEDTTHRLYAWRPGSDDVKLIFALDDEWKRKFAEVERDRERQACERKEGLRSRYERFL